MASCCKGGPLTLECKIQCSAPIVFSEDELRQIDEIMARRQPLTAEAIPIMEYPPPDVKEGSNMAPVRAVIPRWVDPCEPDGVPRSYRHKTTPEEFWDRIAQIEQHDPLSRRAGRY